MVFSLVSCSAILSWLNMLDPLMVNTSSRVIGNSVVPACAIGLFPKLF
jgi:hypothetical protein